MVKYSLIPATKIDFEIEEVNKDPLLIKALKIIDEHPKQYQNAFFFNNEAYARFIENITNMFVGNMTPEQMFEDMDANFYQK